jgi:hypothetical protein
VVFVWCRWLWDGLPHIAAKAGSRRLAAAGAAAEGAVAAAPLAHLSPDIQTQTRMPLNHVALVPHLNRSLLTKPWTAPASPSSTLLKAAAYAAAAGRGAGSGGSGGASDSLFCTNVSGLKGNSPILIGLMEYFSVRPGLLLGAGASCLGANAGKLGHECWLSQIKAANQSRKAKPGLSCSPTHLLHPMPTALPLPAAPHATRGLLPANWR